MPLVTQQGNAIVYKQSTPPTGATTGDVWIDTSTGFIYTWNGSSWVQQTGAFVITAVTSYPTSGSYTKDSANSVILNTASTAQKMAYLAQYREGSAHSGLWRGVDGGGVLSLFSNPVLNDNFTGYTTQGNADAAWASADTAKNRVSITNDNIGIDMQMIDNSNDAIAYDLGTTVSDTAWVLRFNVTFSALTQGAQSQWWAGLSDIDQTNDCSVNHDFITMEFYNASGSERYSSHDGDAAGICAGANDNSVALVWATSTTYYFEIVRLTSTTYVVRRYSNSTYTTVLSSASGTCAATVTGLRYITFINFKTAGAGEYVGTIDDVQFYNGVTAP